MSFLDLIADLDYEAELEGNLFTNSGNTIWSNLASDSTLF